MKVVYGNPLTLMTLGMSMLGDTPTPFIGFVDRSKMDGKESVTHGSDASALIEEIDQMGGVVIYFENPEAAERIHVVMSSLFSNAMSTDWSSIEQSGVSLQ